jgi:beta-lactamase regulating signal transducer with metallopeptidase domain
LCLFSAPLIKSTLLLLGIGFVVPWPREPAALWHARALEPSQVLPFFLLFTGAMVMLQSFLSSRARRAAVAGAVPAETASPRLSNALDDVMQRLEESRSLLIERCGCEPRLARPQLMVAGASVDSPLIATDAPPVIVFPAALIDRLSDTELRGALAHEVAHLEVRAPFSCFSAASAKSLTIANPMATMMASLLLSEEEKACDDVAVAATGDPEAYAGMLLKAYRFGRPAPAAAATTLQYLPQLLGLKPMLSERVERLLGDPPSGNDMRMQYAGFAVVWITVIALFFTH